VLATEFARVFAEQVEQGEHLVLVEAPGHGVLRLSAALADVTKRVRTQQRPGRDTVFANSAGQLTLVLEIRDSETDELLARVFDRREVRSPGVSTTGLALSNSVTQTADLRRTFRRWAQLLHERLVQLQEVEGPPAAAVQ